MDRDGNGMISFDELQNGLGDRENGEELVNILRAADTDNNGTINYTGKWDERYFNQCLYRVLGCHDGRYNFPS